MERREKNKILIKHSIVLLVFVLFSAVYIWSLKDRLTIEQKNHNYTKEELINTKNALDVAKNTIDIQKNRFEKINKDLKNKNDSLEESIKNLKKELKQLHYNETIITTRNGKILKEIQTTSNDNTDSQLGILQRLFYDNKRLYKLYKKTKK